nr:MAG TPA: hypothetical protein [Caudoviricetes sp.]
MIILYNIFKRNASLFSKFFAKKIKGTYKTVSTLI